MSPTRIATPFSKLHAASLLSHKSRIAKFRSAIEQAVDKDNVVLDIGTGTGVLAILAARQGARRVIALDIDEGCINYARQAARANGVEDIIEFRHMHFEECVPDCQVDVVICEMLSSMLLIEQQVPAAIHAREKILARHGVFVPKEATVYLVPVECESVWNRFEVDGLIFPRVPQTIDGTSARDLADASVLEVFDFTSNDIPREVDRELKFKIVDDGSLHGFVGFFESRLYGDLILRMDDGWKPLFLPLDSPISVHKDESISVYIKYEAGNVDSLQLGLR